MRTPQSGFVCLLAESDPIPDTRLRRPDLRTLVVKDTLYINTNNCIYVYSRTLICICVYVCVYIHVHICIQICI